MVGALEARGASAVLELDERVDRAVLAARLGKLLAQERAGAEQRISEAEGEVARL